ncbi:ATP-binding protein [Salipaludibacillus aurantiacus]|uniref:histidine kinase n=1 Tax=Salipaludibacillus aurantiacus TaxID=1601833 RepID=A0A1H9TVG2_9BACI|nr:ATP-binding protein [Salipaludibacillus aurantiacus]SES01360.1 Signal transduction histidine kinase [Salipaludibacillus aurantiacus]
MKNISITLLILTVLTGVIHFFPSNISAESVVLNDSRGEIDLAPYIEVLEDKNNEWTINDVAEGEISEKFELNQGGAPSFGYTSSVYWVRFQLHNQYSGGEWYLKLDNPTMDYTSLYLSENGEFEAWEMGDLYPFGQREVTNRNFIFPLNLSEENDYVIYMRFQSEGAMQLPLTMMDRDSFLSITQQDYIILGLLAGLAFVMALYNLFVYFSLQHKSYLFYVFFIIVNLLTFLSFSGLAYQFIWPEAVWWNNRSIVFFMAVSNILAILFTNSFLEPEKLVPRSVKWSIALLLMNFSVLIVLVFSYPLALDFVVLATGISVGFILTVSLITLKNGFRPARFFSLAWYIFIAGVVVSILTDVGVLPFTFMTKYAWQITTSLELILLSFALADKITIMRKEKDQAKREAIESQQEMLEHLKRTDKLKDEFLAVTSHELRTPLNGIIGIAESMKDGAAGEINDSARKNLMMIITSGKRLAHLINDIIDFSKLKNNDMDLHIKEVDVKETGDMVVNMCQSLVKSKPVIIENHLEKGLPAIAADENRFQQVLYNLIGNAIKYTAEGKVSIYAYEKNGFMKIEVADTGPGIDEEELESIFFPFERGGANSDEHDEGMGIGLNISKRLVELQGGRMNVRSGKGRGSVFTFSIPLYRGQEKRNVAAGTVHPLSVEKEAFTFFSQPETSGSKKTGKKILVADDEPVNLQILINYLSLEGYEVKTASSGEQALRLLEDEKDFDLVILDIMMPKISGYKVCQDIRKTYSLTELPVLMLTAKNQIEDRLAAFEAGANDYLVKPCDKRELLARTETFLHLSRAVKEIKDRAEELNNMNLKLKEMNDILEVKVEDRTKELALKNKEMNSKNEKLIKLEEARIQLLSNISHELGTPITFLQSYVQTVKEGIIDANNPKYLEIVQNKVKLLDRLINDLFDLVKFESGKMSLNIETINLKDWLQHIHETFMLDVETHRLSFPLPVIKNDRLDTEGVLSVDGERMEQVFYNLINNAVKHSLPGGKIEISASICPYDKNKTASEFDGNVIIEVKDNGTGIEEEALPYIFERFYKGGIAENSESGTGLGLAITKEIIDYHKGEIWVTSTKNAGTSFFFSLPLILKRAGQKNVHL